VPKGVRFQKQPAPDLEVDEELAGHIELQIRRFVAEGMNETDARQAAHRRFGSIEHFGQECRELRQAIETDTQRAEWRSDLVSDLRYAVRGLRLQPLFSAVTVLTLALGIGAGMGVLTMVYTVLLKPLPYANAERSLVIWNSYPGGNLLHAAVAVPEYFDMKEGVPSLEEVAALRQEKVPLVGRDGVAVELVSYRVTPNLFTLLGTAPVAGRGFAVGDGSPGAAPAVLLSHALWSTRFGGQREVIGQTLNLGGVQRTVVGVMPPDVRFPDLPLDFLAEPADLWLADSYETLRNDERGNQNTGVVALRRASASRADVRRDLDQLEARFKREDARRYAQAGTSIWRIDEVSLADEFFGRIRQQMILLGAAAIIMLLIACTNVANLLLAHGSTRAGEFAVRRALGARRQRLMRQLLTESTVMALLAGGIGAVLAHLVVRAAVLVNAADVPRLMSARLTAPWILGSVGLGLLAGLIVGLVPALRLSTSGTAVASRGATGRMRLQRALAGVQVALAVTVLIATGLFVRSFLALQRVDPGFSAANVATASISLPRARYDSAHKVISFAEQVVSRLETSHPGAEVGMVYPLPLGGESWSGTIAIVGRERGPSEELPHAEMAVASTGYFKAMGIPLREGRTFSTTDRRDAPWVIVIDERLARQHWPGESAIGRQISVGGDRGTIATVIGVVGHVRNGGARDEGEAQLYMSNLQSAQRPMSIVMRTPSPAAALREMTEAVRAVDPGQPVSRLTTMESLVRSAVARDRFNMVILGVFAGVALTLVTMGLYGLVALTASQRLMELSVRLALGAKLSSVRWLVLRDGARILAAGLIVGLAASMAMSRVVGSMLFGVQPIDGLTYVGIVALLVVVTLGAAARVAWRATEKESLRVLRQS
jgi:predicted permease